MSQCCQDGGQVNRVEVNVDVEAYCALAALHLNHTHASEIIKRIKINLISIHFSFDENISENSNKVYIYLII